MRRHNYGAEFATRSKLLPYTVTTGAGGRVRRENIDERHDLLI